MSLSSTSTIKGQLNVALGPKATTYFNALSQFVSARISRQEFEDSVRQALDAPNLGTSIPRVARRIAKACRSPTAQFLDHLFV